ncbi:hypothetical protein DEO72_LG10g3231 [Vigna unguiculata]|uniref:Uncharacterized protein n=1 Tax=Vigna unguiculata TaxID=3917 RepID=A0A4D6NGF8_VIGUN|nr:hypothetical protein DEO72_LG10g3231 [Vigna unguiculata]
MVHSNAKDIIIDVDNSSTERKDDKLEGYEYDSFSDLVLPPIVTKPAKFDDLLSDAKTDRVLATEALDQTVSLSTSFACEVHSNAKDIIIDVDNSSTERKDDKLEGYEYDSFSDLVLPPIVTKPAKFDDLLSDAKTDRVLATEALDQTVSLSTSFACEVHSNAKDIIIDVDNSSTERKDDKLEGYEYDSFSDLVLPPIVTKPAKFDDLLSDAKTDRVLATEALDQTVSLSTSFACEVHSNAKDIIIDVDNSSTERKDDKLEGYEYDSFSDLVLPPIVTKPAKFDDLLSDAK